MIPASIVPIRSRKKAGATKANSSAAEPFSASARIRRQRRLKVALIVTVQTLSAPF
jgi:hypothetical protein